MALVPKAPGTGRCAAWSESLLLEDGEDVSLPGLDERRSPRP